MSVIFYFNLFNVLKIELDEFDHLQNLNKGHWMPWPNQKSRTVNSNQPISHFHHHGERALTNLLTMAFAFLRLTSEAFNSSFHGVSFAVLQDQVPFILPKLVIFTVFIFNFSSVKLVIQRTVIESKEEYVKPRRTSRSQGTIRFISNF